MSYPQPVARESNRDVLIVKGLMGKKMLTLRLSSPSTGFTSQFVLFYPLMFFSGRRKMITRFFLQRKTKKQHKTNRQTKAKETRRASKPIAPPGKENNTSTYAFLCCGSPPSPPGSIGLLSSLASSLSLRFATHFFTNDF